MVISVLYVDDEEALCDLATRFLNKEPDISCVSVTSAKKALNSLQFEQYDILVTDYQMPGMDGLCLLKEISIRNIDIPVILFTGRGREEVAIEAFNLGATFYVQKGDPVTVQFQELVHKIRIGVDRNRTRKKLIESEQRFRSFFTHTLLGSAILDADARIIEANDYLCCLLGYEKTDLVNTYWPDLLNKGMDSDAGEEKRNFKGIRTGQYDTLHQKPDGTYIALRIALSPILEGTKISGYSLLISDINAEFKLKEQYEELVESRAIVTEHENSIRTVLNALDDCGLLLDLSGNILYFNTKAADFLGISNDSGDTVLFDYLSESDQKILKKGFSLALHLGEDQSVITAKGNQRYEWTVHPIKERKSFEGRIVLFCRDITEIHEIKEELEISRERYRQFAEFLPQSLFEINRDGTIAYLNPHGRTVFQVTNADLSQGMHYEQFIPEQYREFLHNYIFESFLGKDGDPVEVQLLRATQEIFPAFIQTISIREKGGINRIRGIVIDLSNIRQEEQARHELEEKYRTLIENAREIIIVSQDETIQFVNPLGALVTKYNPDELIGKPFSQFIHPEDKQLVYENYVRRIDDPTYQGDYLFRFIDREGGIHWVKTHAIRIVWEGKPATLNMLSEITELIQAQEALKESESRLSSVLNFLPDPTFAVNKNGEVIVWNQIIEKFLHTTGSQILGHHKNEVARLLYGVHRPLLVDLLENEGIDIPDNYQIHRHEKDMVIADVMIVNPEGAPQYLWGKARPLYNQKGEVIGAIESIRDITDRKMIEENLTMVNQKLNLFSSITRHDIRNQLSLIFLAIDNISTGSLTLSNQDYIKKIEESSVRIQNFIDLAREYQEIGVSRPVWNPVLQTFFDVASSLNCVVSCDPGTCKCKNVYVYSDPLIKKVFFNIIDNTVKYATRTPEISVKCQETVDGLIFTIMDNGPGIPEDEKELIFTKGYGNGTGLGLFLVREILGITGMQIRETGIYGKGARFEILIPPGKYLHR